MKMMKKGYKAGGGPLCHDLSGQTAKSLKKTSLVGRGVLDKNAGSGKMAKKKKRSDAMDAVTGTGPAAPRKAMKKWRYG